MHCFELVAINSLLAHGFDDGVVGGERLVVGNFRLVEQARDHQRGSVVVEEIADRILDAAGGVHGDLLLEHELAIDAAGAASVQGLIEHGQRVPIGRAAFGRAIADGDARQRAEFFLDLGAAHGIEWALR